MPATPVTNTVTGSFSMLKKLHKYFISFQKKGNGEQNNQDFLKNNIILHFLKNGQMQQTIPVKIKTIQSYVFI